MLLGVYPYVRLTLHERLAVWGLFGYAVHGELRLDEKQTDPIDTGAGMLMGAFGARGTLLAAPAAGGFEVTATADGMVVRMRSEAVPGRVVATEADVERVRLLLNASYRVAVGGGVLTPRVEVGARYDGGDAETGAGLVVGGSLGYALPAWGLTLSAGGQGLLLHESEGFTEWSAGGSLRLDPGAPDRGVALSVAPSWGTIATTAAALWSLPDAARAPGRRGELRPGRARRGRDGEPVRRSDRGRRRRPHLAGGHELPARPIPQPEPGRHPPRARRRRRARAHPGAARLPAPLTKSTSAHVIASRALEAMESVP